MQWDHHEFKVADHYAPALINGDETGITSEDSRDLRDWVSQCRADVPEGWTVGHWDAPESDSDDWGRCSVSGLFAMRATVRLYFYRKD